MGKADFVLKRKDFYWWEKIYTDLAIRILPMVGKTPLTPNMITLANILNAISIFWLIWIGQYFIAAILVQVYLFLDILDGNLARFKNLCTSLGKILDHICDRLYYNGLYIVLGIKIGIGWEWIAAYLIVHTFYEALATYYIVPGIKRLKDFKRWGPKKYLIERGIILGMDLSAQSLITTVLLFTPFIEWIIYLITILYLADLVFRFLELAINLKIADKKN